jgi:hypothetical protein
MQREEGNVSGKVSGGHLIWIVFCERCDWARDMAPSREDAVRFGRWHVNQRHKSDDEWSFRVQGIRTGLTHRGDRAYTVSGVSYEPHAWEPHPTSRNRGLPCGLCGVFRYLHDEIYGFKQLHRAGTS